MEKHKKVGARTQHRTPPKLVQTLQFRKLKLADNKISQPDFEEINTHKLSLHLLFHCLKLLFFIFTHSCKQLRQPCKTFICMHFFVSLFFFIFCFPLFDEVQRSLLVKVTFYFFYFASIVLYLLYLIYSFPHGVGARQQCKCTTLSSKYHPKTMKTCVAQVYRYVVFRNEIKIYT